MNYIICDDSASLSWSLAVVTVACRGLAVEYALVSRHTTCKLFLSVGLSLLDLDTPEQWAASRWGVPRSVVASIDYTLGSSSKKIFQHLHKCISTHTQLVTRQRPTGHSHIMPRFSRIGFLKNFVNLSFILHTPINLTLQHHLLLYPHLFFAISNSYIT